MDTDDMDDSKSYTPASPSGSEGGNEQELAPLRWRVLNMCLCSVGWCCSISAFFVQVTITALLVVELAGPSLSTVPLGCMLALGFFSVAPLSAAMQRWGKKRVLVGAACSGLCGALIMLTGALTSSVAALIAGAFLQGIAFAAAFNYRFVAIAFADDDFGKPRAVAITTLGGVLSPFVGPELAKLARFLFPTKYTGSYLVLCLLYCAQIMAAAAIQPRLMVPVKSVKAAPIAPSPTGRSSSTLRQTLRSADFLLPGLISGISYGSMSGLMAATPLAMLAGGIDADAAVVAVQCHILGMFVPSLFSGHLIKFIGAPAMVALGSASMLAGNCLYWAGAAFWTFATAITLVGVGWNFAFVSTSTAIGGTFHPQDANAVQGVTDSFILLNLAIVSTSTGALFSAVGWSSFLAIMLAINALWGLLAAVYLVRKVRLRRAASDADGASQKTAA